jgi:hypothetical protein
MCSLFTILKLHFYVGIKFMQWRYFKVNMKHKKELMTFTFYQILKFTANTNYISIIILVEVSDQILYKCLQSRDSHCVKIVGFNHGTSEQNRI